MCTYNVSVDDYVIEQVRPHFASDTDIQIWIEGILHRALLDYVNKKGNMQTLQSEKVCEKVKALESDPDGLFKLRDILTPSKYSAEELRDGYITDKYGI